MMQSSGTILCQAGTNSRLRAAENNFIEEMPAEGFEPCLLAYESTRLRNIATIESLLLSNSIAEAETATGRAAAELTAGRSSSLIYSKNRELSTPGTGGKL